MKRIKKIVITLLIVFLIGAIGVSSLVGIFFYNLALNTNYSKDIVYADHNGDKLRDNEKWLDKESNYTENYIESSDGLNLHAYMINQNESNDKWAIVVHGYGGSGN